MSVIVMAKIVCLGFLARRASGVALIIWISRVFGELWLFIVFYVGSSLVSALGIGLVLNSGSLSIFFIIEYQFLFLFLYSELKLLLSIRRYNA